MPTICAFLPCQFGNASMTACSTFACGKGPAAAAATAGKTRPTESAAHHEAANLMRIRRPKSAADVITCLQAVDGSIRRRLTMRPLFAPSRTIP